MRPRVGRIEVEGLFELVFGLIGSFLEQQAEPEEVVGVGSSRLPGCLLPKLGEEVDVAVSGEPFRCSTDEALCGLLGFFFKVQLPQCQDLIVSLRRGLWCVSLGYFFVEAFRRVTPAQGGLSPGEVILHLDHASFVSGAFLR